MGFNSPNIREALLKIRRINIDFNKTWKILFSKILKSLKTAHM